MLIVAITAVALALADLAIGTMNGVYMSNLTDAQLIRSRFHLRLVQPEWVSSNGSVLMNWIIAETKARLAVIGIFWVAALSFIARYELGGNEFADAN